MSDNGPSCPGCASAVVAIPHEGGSRELADYTRPRAFRFAVYCSVSGGIRLSAGPGLEGPSLMKALQVAAPSLRVGPVGVETGILARDERGDAGVGAGVRGGGWGRLHPVRTSGMIAADGASSRIREALNIGMVGLGELDQNIMINIHFRAELGPWVRGRPAVGYISSQGNGAPLWVHGTGRGLIVHPVPSGRGQRRA